MITTFTASLTTSGSLVELLHSKVEINHPEISDNSINLDHLGLRSHGSTVYGTMKTQDPVPICFFQRHHRDESRRIHGGSTEPKLVDLASVHGQKSGHKNKKNKKNTKKSQNTRNVLRNLYQHLSRGEKL